MVRDRIDMVIDEGTAFMELSTLAAWGQYGDEVPGAGIVTGIGWCTACRGCSSPTTPR